MFGGTTSITSIHYRYCGREDRFASLEENLYFIYTYCRHARPERSLKITSSFLLTKEPALGPLYPFEGVMSSSLSYGKLMCSEDEIWTSKLIFNPCDRISYDNIWFHATKTNHPPHLAYPFKATLARICQNTSHNHPH